MLLLFVVQDPLGHLPLEVHPTDRKLQGRPKTRLERLAWENCDPSEGAGRWWDGRLDFFACLLPLWWMKMDGCSWVKEYGAGHWLAWTSLVKSLKVKHSIERLNQYLTKTFILWRFHYSYWRDEEDVAHVKDIWTTLICCQSLEPEKCQDSDPEDPPFVWI